MNSDIRKLHLLIIFLMVGVSDVIEKNAYGQLQASL